MQARELRAHALVDVPFIVVAVALVDARSRRAGRRDRCARVRARGRGDGPPGVRDRCRLHVAAAAHLRADAVRAAAGDRAARRRGRAVPGPAARRARGAPAPAAPAVGVRRRLVLGRAGLVFLLAGAGDPSWDDWPIYALALAAQFACDLASSTAHESLRIACAEAAARRPAGGLARRRAARADRPAGRLRERPVPLRLPARPPAGAAAGDLRPRAARSHRDGDRAQRDLPRHGADARRRHLIRRRAHRDPRPRRRRAGARDRRRAGPRRGPAPPRRVRGDAPGHRQDRDAARDPQQAGAAEPGGVGADAHPPGRGAADARSRRWDAARRRARRALGARALRGRRLPRRAGGAADPDRGARARRRRRLLRDDDAPPVPAAAVARRRPSPSCARAAARSSTPRSSTPPAPSSPGDCPSCRTSSPTRPERALCDRSVSLSTRLRTPRNMAATGEPVRTPRRRDVTEDTEELLA